MPLTRFLRDRNANVAPLVALVTIPLLAFVGSAVDYSRAASVRSSLQAALDSTALMLSKNALALTEVQLQEQAVKLFSANFTRPEAANPQVTVAFSASTGGYAVSVTGATSVQTHFMSIFGIPVINVSSIAKVKWSNSRLRVALVLDVTGSMSSSGKITALKTATHKLLDQLRSVAKVDGDVYVSIIPFSKDVNVGPANYDASWIDWTDWEAVNGTCSKSTYKSKTSCNNNGGVWTPKAHNTWNGCVTDRNQNYDTLNTTPLAGGTLFPAEQYSSCPTPLLPLSYDWAALHSKVDALAPAGNTNQGIGLVWGWQSLTGGPPLNAPALDPNYTYQQVIILLSDGLNTENRWYTTAAPIDARQQITCTNAKSAGIVIYTVLVMSGNSTVLQNCASDPNKYFALTDANQIITTFQAIGTELTKLHLSY
ncbi:MAG TPA: pilus assembly protein TadG-related protein [Xanthobacteraceae bacterium]|nr:pilus assembly protein TadG-related protein [Xanthobacteraceae bacterium]